MPLLALALFLLAEPVSALEKVLMLDLEQSWQQGSTQSSKLSAQLELSNALSSNTAFTAIIRAQVLGPNSRKPGIPEQDAVAPASRRLYLNSSTELEIRELYLDLDFDAASLRLGKQQVVWGQADGLKLLDVINPQDFREFILADFDASRIPLWIVNLEIFLPAGDLQILWIPDTSMHNFPELNATYAITAPFVGLPAGLSVVFEPIDRPDDPFQDSDFGLRFSSFVSGWDVTANYLYHYDDFPIVQRKVIGTTLVLSPGYERTHTLGGSASNAFGDFIFRAEAVYNSAKFLNTENQSIQSSPEFAYVLGLDWSGLQDTFVSLQLFQSLLLYDHDFVRDKLDTNLTFLLRRDFLNQSLKLEMLWIYHHNESDNLLRFSSDYELTSNTTISIFADIFSGQPDELFGQFEHNDRVGVNISIGF